jgi:pimeloyl-ACP methyl ester carboxylesterase
VIHRFDAVLPHGITLACRCATAAPLRPRVMLLHGFPEAAFVWDEVMTRLASATAGAVSCVAPNLRGYAGSSAPAELAAYRAKPLIGDLVALIEQLGAPLDLLVAHDWGGALAWGLAAARPDLMKRLLIINAPHAATFLRELRDSPAQQLASAYMNEFCAPAAQAALAADDYARLWPFFGVQPAWLGADERERFRAVWGLHGQGLVGPINYYRATPLRPPTGPADPLHTLVLPDEAVTVRVPTTVLWGEGDHALLPGLLDGLQRWVPDLAVQRVPDATHWLVHEQPQRVVDTISSLLAQA